MKEPGQLPPELESLVIAEREAPTGTATDHRRIRTRLGIGLGGLGAVAGEGAATGGAVTGGSVAVGGAGAIGSSLVAKVIVATVALGTAAGGGYLLGRRDSADSARRPAQLVTVAPVPGAEPAREARWVSPPERELQVAPVVDEAVRADEPTEEPHPRPPSVRVTPSESDPSATASDEAPPAEVALIVRAWRAVEAGDFMAADIAIESHERQFPHGVLSEERDALRVRNLVASGEQRQAADRAAAFFARYPGSVHTTAVERALKGVE